MTRYIIRVGETVGNAVMALFFFVVTPVAIVSAVALPILILVGLVK